MKNKLIYLASPYVHEDPNVINQRFTAACIAAKRLIQSGYIVFSPIAHSHAIAQFGLPSNWDFWKHQDIEFLNRCDELVVLMLPSWETSNGVREEITQAQKLGKNIFFMEFDDWPPGDKTTCNPTSWTFPKTTKEQDSLPPKENLSEQQTE